MIASATRPHRWGRDVLVVCRAVATHPSLSWTAAGTVLRLARQGWWHRAPFLPLPGEDYWRFRLVTAYGGDGEGESLTPDDVVDYLRWCRMARPGRG